MIQYVDRNLQQLDLLLSEFQNRVNQNMTTIKDWKIEKMTANIAVAKEILAQQIHMATTRGRSVANRIVSFHWPEIRPMVRGKEGKSVEFGPKAHVGLVDGYVLLDHFQFDAFHEGVRLSESLDKHVSRFGQQPDLVLADQIYANRNNRQLLKDRHIEHGFKRMGRPPDESKVVKKKYRQQYRKRQDERNPIEGAFGHLKNHVNLNKITWSVPGGAHMQTQFGFIAANLQRAMSMA
jgi:hypothetical protein